MIGGSDPCNNDYTCDIITLYASSRLPLATTHGSFIGYDRVEEIIVSNTGDGSNAGKIVRHFHNTPHKLDNIILLDHVKNGKMHKMEVFDSSGLLLKKNDLLYSFDIGDHGREQSFATYMIGASGGQDNRQFLCDPLGANSTLVWEPDLSNISQYDSCRLYKSKWGRTTSDYETAINHTVYLSRDTETSYFYDQNNVLIGEVVNIKNMKYDSMGHYQMTSEDMTNSDGTVFMTHLVYALGYTGNAAIRSSMLSKNMVGIPLQTFLMVGSDTLFGTELSWSFFDANGDPIASNTNFLNPYQEKHFERNFDGNNQLTVGVWDTKFTINKYDIPTGLSLGYQEKGWNTHQLIRNNRGQVTSDTDQDYVQSFAYDPIHHMLSKLIRVDGTFLDFKRDNLLRLEEIDDPVRGYKRNWAYNFGTSVSDPAHTKITETFAQLGNR